MSLLRRWVLPVVAVGSFAFLVGCGGNNSSNSSTPPPSGGFTNSNFSGTYTFSTSGSDLGSTGTGGPLAIAGTFTACGCTAGTISAGTVDITDTTGPGAGIAIASGSGYKVSADGTGTFGLNIPTTSGTVQFTFNFVLTDSAHGLVIENDTNGTGSGTIDLQPSPVTLPNGSYALSLSGGGSSTSIGLVGGFTLASGSIMGLVDQNNNGTAATAMTLTGSISTGTGTSPGTATLTYGTTTLHLDVYAIDTTHVKLVESDSQAVLSGDLFDQTSTSIPSATLVFTMAGLDSSGNPLVAGGTVLSSGGALTSGAEDVNDFGTVDGGTNPATPASFTGGYTLSPSGNTNGRYAVALSNFTGGTNFAAYPSSGGILMLEVEPAGSLFLGTTAGTALPQASGASGLVASQGYAMNLTGMDLVNNVPLDQIAQFNTSGTSISGVLAQNDFTINNTTPTNFSGSYTTGSVGSVTLSSVSEEAFYYAVDSTTALAISVDPNETSVGAFEQQGSPSSAAAEVTQRHLAMLRAVAHARSAKQKRFIQ